MRKVWADSAWEEYLSWQGQDPKVVKRINQLIRECERTPFTGTGKPEPLHGSRSGWWSRRITGEHRLVYAISGKGVAQSIEIAQCRGHYDDWTRLLPDED